MTEWRSFNVNHRVRVKLTERGLEHYAKSALSLREKFPKLTVPLTPTLTEDGWYETQMWSLMNEFGEMMYAGMSSPFETDIQIEARE